MKGGLEFIGCLALSAAAHAVAWGVTDIGPPSGGGSEGAARLQLAAVPAPTAHALIAAWTAPPATDQTAATPFEPPAPMTPERIEQRTDRPIPDHTRNSPVNATRPAAPGKAPTATFMATPTLRAPRPPLDLPAQPTEANAARPIPPSAAALHPVAAPAGAAPKIDLTPAPPPTSRAARTAAPPRARPEPRAEPTPAQPAVAVASRGVTGTTAGRRDSGGSNQSTVTQRDALQSWGAKIRARLAQSQRAGRRGLSGRSVLRLTVATDGRLLAARITASAGNARIDRAALDAARRAGRMPPAPKGLSPGQYSFEIPIRFN